MGGLAAFGACDRLDVLRPAPPRLEGGPAHRSGLDIDQLQLAAAGFEPADLFRGYRGSFGSVQACRFLRFGCLRGVGSDCCLLMVGVQGASTAVSGRRPHSAHDPS